MAVAADQVTVEVLAKLDGAKRDVVQYADGFERNMKRVEVSSNRAEATIAQTANRQRAALQQVGIQFGDFTTQLSLGANVFQAFGAQAGQAAGALVNFGGTVGRVAGFLAGPAGSLLIALTAVAGIMLTSADNSEKAAEKARKQGEAARNLKEAVQDLDDASGRNNTTQQETIRLGDIATRKFRDQEVAARKLTVALLEQARANLVSAQARSTDPTLAGEGGFNPGAVAASNYASLIAELDARLKDQNSKIAEASKSLIGGEVTNSLRRVEEQLDATAAATGRYERAVEALRTKREAGAITQAEFDRQALGLAKRRDSDLAAAANARRAATDQRKAERDATREAEAAERAYWSTVKAGNAALADAAEAGQNLLDERLRQAAELRDKVSPSVEQQAKDLMGAGDRTFDERMSRVADSIQAAQAASYDLKADLADAFGDAVTGADNFGDAMVRAFERAAAAAVASRVFDFLSTGSIGDLFAKAGNVIANRPAKARASGGHVSAGQLYRVNEGGVEGFQPAGSGKIIPLGQMAARPQGGVTVMQPVHFDMRGAITTPELLADINGKIAQSGQAAAIAGKGMALASMSKARRRQLG